MTIRRSSRPAPRLDYEDFAAQLPFAKGKYRAQSDDQIDTRELQHRKIHPEREPEFLRWLKLQPCVIAGKVDAETGQAHVCWSPDEIAPKRFLSDPMHTGKAYSGKLKRTDRGAIPGCRHAHRQQEDNMDRFDRRYGIDRHALAAEFYARFIGEKERRS